MISRRELLAGALMTGFGLPSKRDVRAESFRREIHGLERRHGGRLGVAVLDTQAGRRLDFRGGERFPLCSTWKALGAAFVLARVDRGEERLGRRVVYGKDALVSHSPTTERHVGEPGLTVGELCEAAMALSDNAASNLLLDGFGGPAALTAYLRRLNDSVTRLDRRETALNEALTGDPRDTTTPLAMVETLHRLLLGDALSPSSRAQLCAWLVACKTGDKRLRAGIPKGWRVGDKTGTGENGATNDVAIFWPPHRAPILVAAYFVGSHASDDERSVILAEVGRLVSNLSL